MKPFFILVIFSIILRIDVTYPIFPIAFEGEAGDWQSMFDFDQSNPGYGLCGI